MATLTQKGKPLRLTTPLGPDVLLLERMVMDEGVSRPFSLQLELLSLNTSIDTKDILRKQVTVEIDLADGSTRYVNGVVRRFSQHERDKGLVTYRAEVVPSIWLLSLSSDCRVFQNMTTTEIVKKVFDEAGFKDYKVNVTGAQGTREYCVQYRESHLDFVSRLLEEEGIFYFFEHTSKANTIVLADAPSAIKPAMVARMSMTVAMSAETGEDTIDELEIGSVVTSAKVTLLDYNDQTTKKISTSIAGTATAYGLAKSEVFDYPGEFAVVGDGERIARVRMDELEAQTHSIRGRTLSRGLASGQKLTVADHYRTDVNGAYHLLTLHHEGTVGDYVSGGGEAFSYSATFMGIPALVPFRPARVTPKSIVHGTQTAVVVGPSGEEIYVDKYGRVKVQFFWDREGTMDDKSSCWVRVSNAWAGKQWGFIQIPRIGQEVIVDFLEGDPDRPIITGR
ncbi:MAG: type VI secretion system tip protein TssI/VgrG, partial [Polyangiaceae bacterium]